MANIYTIRQNPQCEGINLNRRLFNLNVSDEQTHAGFYKISKSKGETYVIDAGEAAGITVGAEFEVYQDHNSTRSLGTVVADKLSDFSTTLCAKKSRIVLEQDGVAIKSRAGTDELLRVYVADKILEDIVKRIDQIQLVEREKAVFGMALEEKKVVFNIYDSDVTKHGLTRMPHSVEPTFEAISPVIRAATHFFWHRRRTPKTDQRGLVKRVSIEVNEVEKDFDDQLKPFFKPITTSGNLKEGQDFNPKTDSKTTYGFTIRNELELSLYISIFYFDNSDWSISEYQPQCL